MSHDSRSKWSREAHSQLHLTSALSGWPWLLDHWFALNDQCGIPWQTAELQAHILVSQYEAGGRYYHSLQHIEACLRLLDACADSCSLAPHVGLYLKWALWFHDCVDERFDKEGVAKSADTAVAYLSAHASPENVIRSELGQSPPPDAEALDGGYGAREGLCAGVRFLILATDYSKSAPPVLSQKDSLICPLTEAEVALMRDIDLSTLGSEPESYAVYADSIRKEYAQFDDEAYRAGRARVLKHFLGMPRIYQTAWFRDRFEVPARANLSSELATLSRDP